MRFLRGLGIAILGFFLWVVCSIFAALSTYESNTEFSFERGMQEAPIWTIGMILGFIMIFAGPVYYWILEPILMKRKGTVPQANPMKYCIHCRGQIGINANFCTHCGKNQ